MPTERQHWGHFDGEPVNLFTIQNATGASLVLSDFGASAIRMNMPAPSGDLADVILGFDDFASYLEQSPYFGATCGRFGNRLRRGQFPLDGVAYQVTCNDGFNSLHGGINGIDRRIWEPHFEARGNAVRFLLVSPHGDEGFPGRLELSVEYTLTDDHRVRILMVARTDRPTICNLVHHSYFNLAGHAVGTVLNQELLIDADFYTPVDEECIITGEVLRVSGTPFDFRAVRAIGDRIREVSTGSPTTGLWPGYDHNWCLRGESGRLRRVLLARDPVSGRGFELFTTEPGIHINTGGGLDASMVGKCGMPYQPFSGFTLQTQRFPDSPNLSHVPQSRLDPGEEYRHLMELRFLS
jgi:aldose 1-epimerase